MASSIGFLPPSGRNAGTIDILPAKHEDAMPMDDAARTRRRRRRTSPQDQAILENEYRKCDRPDKARRKEITRIVNLGEKEVQIWFCNKRQAQRRRATPLQPHELIPRSSQNASSSQESLEQFTSSSPRFVCLTSDSVLDSVDGTSSPTSIPASKRPTSDDGGNSLAGPPHDNPPSSVDPQRDAQRTHETKLPQPLSEHTESRASAPPTMITLTPESEMTTSAHQRLQEVLSRPPPAAPSLSRRTTSTATTPAAPPRLLKRSSSVRLSTNLEGKATVILEDDPPLSSSPPMPARKPSISRPTRRKPLGPVDSKLWEFCCDNQSAIRSPQSTPPQPAEATQALQLLRGMSTNSIPRRWPGERLPKSKKRKVLTGDGHHSGPRKGVSIFEPSVDSDKENRPPGAPVSPPPEPKPSLMPSLKMVKPALQRGLRDRSVRDDVGYDASQESVDVETESGGLAALINSSQGDPNSSPRRIAEIECIENLLSLRSGSWR